MPSTRKNFRPRRNRSGRNRPRLKIGGLNKTERKQTNAIAKKVVLRNQEVKQRAFQINSVYTLYHNVQAELFGNSTNGGLLELQQQGATTGTHLTSRPHPVSATPLNNPGYLREGNKINVSSVHLNLNVNTAIDRQGTKLRCIMFWYPVGHSTTWSDLVADSGMTGNYNQLLVPTNRNSVCKIFMDKVYTLGSAGAGGNGNYQSTTMIKLRKSFKGGKSIEYKSGAQDNSPDRWNIGFMCCAFNNNQALVSDQVAFMEYSGNIYFRDA